MRVFLITTVVVAAASVRGLAAPFDRVDYTRDIRPILAARCVRCHGPQKQKASLRLDTAARILAGGNRGAAAQPGKGGESLLILAVKGLADFGVMPPEGPTLTADEIAGLERWIEEGAVAPAGEVEEPARTAGGAGHWAFHPIRRPRAPAIKGSGRALSSPIDTFILARLEAEGVDPAPEADRATLIRRLSLDLLGLSPEPEDVERFQRAPEPDACERLADRLLASPHYGERWARRWLDLARYADSNGYTIDGSRSIWKYRDWVIAAINGDMPFDRFTIEQIAGDMLPGATIEQRIATGFHRNTLRNEEGGTDAEQFRVEAVADRVSTTATVFLGLTIGCARCHDHKYDPLTQREYYQLFALLNNADEPVLQVPTGQQAKELPALDTELAAAEKLLADNEAAVATRQVHWEKKLEGRLAVSWAPFAGLEVRAEGGLSPSLLEDGSVLVRSGADGPARLILSGTAPIGGVTALRLEALTHDDLPRRGPGLAANGNFILSEIKLSANAMPLPFDAATADHSQEKHLVEYAIDGDPDTGWAINVGSGRLNVDRVAVFRLGRPVAARGAGLEIELRHAKPRYVLGRFRLSITDAAAEVVALPERIRRILSQPAAGRREEEKKAVAEHYRAIDKDRIPLAARVADLKRRREQLSAAVTTTLVLAERKEPRATFIHLRGDFLRPGARVDGAVPAVLPRLTASGPGTTRLDLARWLVDPRNPLTPRVTVNRLWQAHFGRGIVETENDFGTQGSRPTHADLLDWLASELLDSGWSVKALHRRIVTSHAYRQSSRARPEVADLDPYNRLLARQSRLRLDAEAIRDALLASSGLLTREVGGPGVYPPQPQGLFRFTQTAKYWKESEDADRYRRAMYTYFWRSSPYPFLMTFDAPDANVACTRRERSNTPLQALTLANDPAFFEMAQALAVRTLREASQGDGERLGRAFRLCLAREPSPGEARRLFEHLAAARQRFQESPEEAKAAAPPGRPGDCSMAEGAAWTAVARVLLNLDELITRE